MPRYKFKCTSCDKIEPRRVKVGTTNIDCECGNKMVWQMPTLNGASEVLETVDKDSGTEWRADHKDDLEKRKAEYFWKHEVPRLVDSGVYGLDTLLENGWIIINEKGQIEVQTKPPHRR